MLIGIVGAPNKGKSTLFSALTLAEVDIADYPFTTIDPNRGVAYVPKTCVEKTLGVKCNARNSVCMNGTRLIPINIVDIAGLVPGASLGKGMGNQFLNDVMAADALVQVVDATGKTDLNGNAVEDADPAEEVQMIADELKAWLGNIIKRNSKAKSGKGDPIMDSLRTFRFNNDDIEDAAKDCALSLPISNWSDASIERFAAALLKRGKPIVVAANKADAAKPEQIERLKKKLRGYVVVETSAAIELALKKAAKAKAIEYVPGAHEFEMKGNVSNEQAKALDYMKAYISKNGTGVSELLNKLVFEVLHMISVYPVEDENKFTDHYGNVLPDVLLIENNSTAKDLARKIHTDLAAKMLYAVDAKKKMRMGKDHPLQDDDVIKIVSAAK